MPILRNKADTVEDADVRDRELLVNADAFRRAVLNSSSLSSIVTDATGIIQIFNVGAERMLGYTAVDVTNKMTLVDIFDPQEVMARAVALSAELDTPIAPGFAALVFKASTVAEDNYELTYIRKDGSPLPAMVSFTAIRDPQGVIIGYLLIGTDNSARQQAERALRKASALQRAILSSANFSSIATDGNGIIQIFNVGAERMLGYSAADVLNRLTPADLSDPEEVSARALALSAELGTPIAPGFEALVFKASRGIEDIYELTYLRKDGSRLPAVVSVTALRDDLDAVIGYLLIITDNSTHRQVEEERREVGQQLRNQHFYTRSLIESNTDALITTDPQGIITDVNKQTEALTGSTRDELIGAPFKQHFTDADRAEAGIRRVLAEGRVTNYELTARARDGSETVVSCNATRFQDRERRLQGVIAMARDITELKQFEATLQRKNAELEKASRMKSEFLASMSHELRTPLNAIIGFSELLQDGLIGELTDQQRGFIGDIFRSGKHLLALINDILDLSRVEAGKMVLDPEPVAIASLFANSLSIVREKATNRQIRLSLEVADDVGSIDVDARKVKQIVYNLLSNAMKFTNQGGQVTLRAARVPRADVGQLSSHRKGRRFPVPDNTCAEFLKISVTDNGIGISPDELERLFTPFSQIDSSLARKFEGSGLGLVLIRMLTELHGGTVAVDSAEGDGSCFTVWLPIPSADTAAVTAAATADGQPQTVVPGALVVAEEARGVDLIRAQLELAGFQVRHATSAAAALVLATHSQLSLIVLDLLLPGMDGWEFIGHLKHLPALRRIPIVIISIGSDDNAGLAIGASAIVQKPVERLELYESLVDLGLFPLDKSQRLKVLIVDDDPDAVELSAIQMADMASTVLRAYGGVEAVEIARRELPHLIMLELIMPELNGFDVVAALNRQPATAAIPVLVVTGKETAAEDRVRLNAYLTMTAQSGHFDQDRFKAEVRRAMSGRHVAD